MVNRLVRNMNKFENQIDQNFNIFHLFLLYSSVVDLQCYAHFCCMAKWLSYTRMDSLFHVHFCSGLSQDIKQSSLCSTAGPCCLSILCIIVCICWLQTWILFAFIAMWSWMSYSHWVPVHQACVSRNSLEVRGTGLHLLGPRAHSGTWLSVTMTGMVTTERGKSCLSHGIYVK